MPAPATEVKVGPHGYEHGWVFVGVPGAGQAVHHPRHGPGMVTHADATHVHVTFSRGGHKASFERAKGNGPGRIIRRPEGDTGGEAQRAAGKANADAQARMNAVAQAGRDHFSAATGMAMPHSSDIKPAHSSAEIHEAIGHLGAGRYAEADDAFSRAFNKEVDGRDMTAAHRVKTVRDKVKRATADAKPVPPTLARAGINDDGSMRAVDHRGNEYAVNMDDAGVVSVTHGGKTLTRHGGAHPTPHARMLAGQLTGQPISFGYLVSEPTSKPKRAGGGSHEMFAGDIEQTAAAVDTSGPGEAAQRALEVQSHLRNAAASLRAGNHGEAFTHLHKAGMGAATSGFRGPAVTIRDGDRVSSAVQQHMTSVLDLGPAPGPGGGHRETHDLGELGGRSRQAQIEQTPAGKFKTTINGNYLGTSGTIGQARALLAKRMSGAAADAADAKRLQAFHDLADQVEQTAHTIDPDAGVGGNLRAGLARAVTALRAGDRLTAKNELADVYHRHEYAAQAGRGRGSGVRDTDGHVFGPQHITKHVRALDKL